MNEKFAQYRERMTQYWMQLGKSNKILLVSTIGVLLLTIIILTFIFSRTQYELAFRDLDTADAASIMQHLEANKIPYQLGADGTTISVPSAVVSKVRVDVGSQGFVKNGSIGFDIFGQGSSTFGRTDNEFNVMYRNALNGEIQRMLNGLQGVQRSNVLVNLPEESVFLNPNEKERASASVLITFKPGYRPTQAEIDGYFNLVKTAVPNLQVEDITITSQEAELFASSKVDGIGTGSAQPIQTQFEVQRKYESELRRSIQQFLGRMYGQERIVIFVSSTLNFDQKSSRQMLVQPLENNNNNGIIISEAETSRSATGSDAQIGGVTGTGESDVPGYQATDPQGASSSEEMSRTVNYDVSRITNEIVSGPFVIKDLAISVGLDEAEDISPEIRNEVANYLTTLVRSQLADSGQDVNNDALMAKKVSVFVQQFANNGSETTLSGLSLPWVMGLGAAALALIGGAVFIAARRRKQSALAEDEHEEMLQPAKIEYPTIDLENLSNENQARKQLEQLAKRKPEEFVNLLRTWLVDE